MKPRLSILVFFTFLLSSRLMAQDVLLPEGISQDYIFTKSIAGTPKIILKNGVYHFKKKWTFKDYETQNDSLKLKFNFKSFDNQSFTALNDSLATYLIISGGGHVFSQTNKGFLKEDNSVEQKNQFESSVFTHKNQIYMYGGYGFWTFKDYITTFDTSTGQWELVSTKSDFIPQERWKAIFQVLNDKLYVLGGRNSPKDSEIKDIVLSDYFYFDLLTKTFVDLGEINPEIPVKYSYESNVNFELKKAYLEKNKIVIFDFKKDTVTSFRKENLFEGIDTNRPVIEHLDTLYFIKNKNNKSFLAQFPLNDLKTLEPELYPITLQNENPYKIPLAAILAVLICFVVYKLFSFKDFLKGLVLYDDKKIYYGQNSSLLSQKQLTLIKHIESKNYISSTELNKIISSKVFVKSHFTALRTSFIEEINTIYKSVTNTPINFIEEIKDPLDKRYKVYKITKQVAEKKSFFSFLFKP